MNRTVGKGTARKRGLSNHRRGRPCDAAHVPQVDAACGIVVKELEGLHDLFEGVAIEDALRHCGARGGNA